MTLDIDRDNIFQHAYNKLQYRTVDELRSGDFEIKYKDDVGMDAGGLTRDFYIELSKAMFNPNYNLFRLTDNATNYYCNPNSHINEEHLDFFKFIGRIVGKAIYDKQLLECYFAKPLYKMMLGEDLSCKDLEDMD